MKSKKNVLMIAAIVLVVISFSLKAKVFSADETFDFKAWGSALNKEFKKQKTMNSNKKYRSAQVKKEIYLKGKKSIIYKDDIMKTSKFYEASGMDKEQAKEEAVKYLKEYETLYTEATEKGYTVTETEVEEYVKEIKKSFHSEEIDSESKKQIDALIQQFDTEEDYWKYEESVYEKSLPIQKFVGDLQKKYYKENESATQDDWNDFLKKYENHLISQEKYEETIINEERNK